MVSLQQRRMVTSNYLTGQIYGYQAPTGANVILPSSYSAPLSPTDVWAKTQVSQLMNMPRYFDDVGKSTLIMWGANKTPISSEALCVHCVLTHPVDYKTYCRNVCRIYD